MAKYLLEIGTEELPYKFVPTAMEQLKEQVSKILTENRVTFGEITTYGTPRRLSLIIDNISESQPDLTRKIKGPPANVAFDKDKNLTPAGLGFAKKQNLSADILFIEKSGEIEYVFAEIKEEGKPVSEVLSQLIPQAVLSLQGSHFMRWADLDIKFQRPIRWIVSLLDEKEVKMQIGNAKSGRISRGHRFAQYSQVEISSVDSYLEDLSTVNVIVNQDERKNIIRKQVNEKAEAVGGKAYIDERLLDEVTYLVEYPVAFLGEFEEKYLEIPQSVVTTVMAAHQRYFPVFAQNSENILNYFITITNYLGDNFENIKKGNERVIKARLDDAIFFCEEDKKKTLVSRIEELKGVTFQKGLGTMFDKTERIKKIACVAAKKLNLDEALTQKIEKTASLCKADLVTSLVREFTELQGIIGGDYALKEGEDSLVANGVREHYLPISVDSGLANSLTGQIVGISDKIDTIVAVFAIGKAPTGSADPLALRRAALGIIQTVLEKDINLNIAELINNAIELLTVKIQDKNKLCSDISEFIIQRFRVYLNDKYKYDVVEAALSSHNPLECLTDVLKRAEVLTNLVSRENYASFHEAANRIIRIIKDKEDLQLPNAELFVINEEKVLYEAINKINDEKLADNGEYTQLIAELEACIPAIDKFFEHVLVMDENLDIRQNRMKLLTFAKLKFQKIADFSKIVA
ncbi:MAG: glycine--tRNA ligase subunit beta [bacterium]